MCLNGNWSHAPVAHQHILMKENLDVRSLVNHFSILLASITCGEKENTQNVNKQIFFPTEFCNSVGSSNYAAREQCPSCRTF